MQGKEVDSRISALDWEKTPDIVKTVVSELADKIQHLEQQYELLNLQMKPLSEQAQKLEKMMAERKKPSSSKAKGFRQSMRSLTKAVTVD